MPFTGDFAALRQLGSTFRRAKSPSFKTALARKLAAAAKKLVADGFRQEKDPYGRPWAPLKKQRRRQGRKRKRSDRILQDRGLLKNSWSTRVSPAGFILGSDRPYAWFIQHGTRALIGKVEKYGRLAGKLGIGKRKVFADEAGTGMPARKLVPDEGHLGEIWGNRFRKVSEDYVRDFFTRGLQ